METQTISTDYKRITLEYFIPKNQRALQSLVGKPIGIILRDNFEIMIYADIVRGLPEFVRQEKRENFHGKFLTDHISGYELLVPFDFGDEGVVINFFNLRQYTPDNHRYNERLQWLKKEGLWKEVKRN